MQQPPSSSGRSSMKKMMKFFPNSKKPCLDFQPDACKKKQSTKSNRSRKYLKKWDEELDWLVYDADCDGAFCKLCKLYRGLPLRRSGLVWTTKPFTNWKNAMKRMQARVGSDSISMSSSTCSSQKPGTVVQQLQNIAEEERMTNRIANKAFFCCAYFLAHKHIPHTTNFEWQGFTKLLRENWTKCSIHIT